MGLGLCETTRGHPCEAYAEGSRQSGGSALEAIEALNRSPPPSDGQVAAQSSQPKAHSRLPSWPIEWLLSSIRCRTLAGRNGLALAALHRLRHRGAHALIARRGPVPGDTIPREKACQRKPARKPLVATSSRHPPWDRSAQGAPVPELTPLPLRTGPCRPRTCRVHRRTSRACRGCRGRRNRRTRSRFRSTRRHSRCS